MKNQASSTVGAPSLESIRDAAVRLGVSIHHFRVLIGDGVIPPGVTVRLGRRIYIHRRRLDDWVSDGGSGFSGGWRREPSDDSEAAAG